jgi:lysophospholipase L1-like esterase
MGIEYFYSIRSSITLNFKQMIALNKKHQARVNKAVYWLTKYNTANDMRNDADGDGNEKMYKKYDNLCQKTFDKYEEYTSELPAREVKQIEKSELY